MLHKNSGIEVFNSLRNDEVTSQIPFIFLSSKPAGPEHQQMLKKEGVTILVKPFTMDAFINSVHNCLLTNYSIHS